MLKLPPWAISDEEALEMFPDDGFLALYRDYAIMATDAPVIYHIGSIFTALGMATSNMGILIQSDMPGYHNVLSTPLWSVVVGNSGDRKSKSMSLAIALLKRAVKVGDSNQGIFLPSDGSIEAWTEQMADCNNAMFFRTEIATLFEQAHRSYSQGLKSWMLELYDGDMYERATLSGGKRIIERPRLSVLGAIPPDTFKSKISKGDWSSGLLPRYLFWCGQRTHWLKTPIRNERKEMELANWLHQVACKSTGYMVISPENVTRVDDWIQDNVEKYRGSINDALYSHLIRFGDNIYRLACMYTLSRRRTPVRGALDDPHGKSSELLYVEDQDIARALHIASVIKKSSTVLFGVLVTPDMDINDSNIIDYIRDAGPTGKSMVELQEKFNTVGRRVIQSTLDMFVASGELFRYKHHSGTAGKPGYRWTSDADTCRKSISETRQYPKLVQK